MTPVETVNSLIEAFERRDMGYILDHVSKNSLWQAPPTVPWGGKYIGPEGVKDFFTALAGNWEQTGFRINEQVADGYRVVTLGSFEGKGRKSGKSATSDFCWVWQVKDGMVTDFQGHFDSAAVVAALG